MGVKVQAVDTPPAVPQPTIRTFLAAEWRRERKSVQAVMGTAIWNVLEVVRNSILCTAAAWSANFLYARGNVFSRTPVGEQSYTSFVVSLVGLFYITSGLILVVVIAQVLRAQYRNLGALEDTPSLWFCIVKLSKRTCVSFVVLLGLDLLTAFLFSFTPASVRAIKIEFYLDAVFSFLFMANIDVVAREIVRREADVRRESIVVRKASRNQQQPLGEQPVQTAPTTLQSESQLRPPSNSATKPLRSAQRSKWSKFRRHFCSTFSLVSFFFIAGAYVELGRHIDLSHGGTVTVLIFTAASTLLKFAMQELAKRAVMRRGVRDIRPMCIIVSLPTVLIDTQIRLVVQRFGSQQDSLAGTLFIALLEIAMRVGKVWFVKWEVFHHRAQASAIAASSSSHVATIQPVAQGWTATAAIASTATSGSSSATAAAVATRIECERWKRNVWKLYTAEVHADMAAEYIAIGCSTSILFFYSAHPKYELCIADCAVPSGARDQVTGVAIQVAVEMVVDVLATILELRGGMDVRELHKHNAFIVTFFALLAICNIQISSSIFLIAT